MEQGSGTESTFVSRHDRELVASCCSGTGIKIQGGREWRCPCGLTPTRPLRVERLYEELESAPPGSNGTTRESDIGARSHQCGVESCPLVTSDKKPFCADHLDRLGHADQLRREIAARDKEQKEVLHAGQQGWMKVDVNGSTARDILSSLRANGPQDYKSLARLVSIGQNLVRPYVAALKKAGLINVAVSETSSIVEIA